MLVAIVEDQATLVAHRDGKIPLNSDENKNQTAGIHATGDHARGEHYCDHTGSSDFKAW